MTQDRDQDQMDREWNTGGETGSGSGGLDEGLGGPSGTGTGDYVGGEGGTDIGGGYGQSGGPDLGGGDLGNEGFGGELEQEDRGQGA